MRRSPHRLRLRLSAPDVITVLTISITMSFTHTHCKLQPNFVCNTAACNGQNFIGTSNSSAMNHLLFGKTALRCTSIGPIPGSIPLKYIQDVKKPEPYPGMYPYYRKQTKYLTKNDHYFSERSALPY